MDKDTIIAEHKEDVRRNRMAHSGIWKWCTLVLVIILIISWYANGLPFLAGGEQEQDKNIAGERAIAFVNENLLAGFASATITSVEETGDLYEIGIDITATLSGETQNATLYVTKDGDLLFPSAIDISAFEYKTELITTTNITVDAGEDPVIGNPNASVTIVEFADFECPFCGQVYPTIKALLEKYPDQVNLVFKNFPLEKHVNAQKSAEAGECAYTQGKFEAYYNILYQNQDALEVDDLKRYASDLELDTAAFNDCLDSGAMEEEVALDTSEGIQAGIEGTPTFFINGVKLEGNLPLSAFEEIVEAELAKESSSEEDAEFTEEANTSEDTNTSL